MDYFTKWADGIPLRDQKATTIMVAVVKVCIASSLEYQMYVLYSDKGILRVCSLNSDTI